MTASDQTGTLHYSILGSFECTVGGVEVRLRGPLQERLAVYLLLNHGRVVPISRLVEAVWDDGGPETATHQVRKMISNLRMRIPALNAHLTTLSAGYRLAIGPAGFDLIEFHKALRLAQKPADSRDDEPERIIAHLGRALQLWRGPVLDGDGGLVINAASTALEEYRVSAMERRFEFLLALGQFEKVLGELRDGVARYPVRERLREQLMLALYLSGSRAEAFDEFHRIRRLLDETYGVDPGPGLTSLYQRFLQNDETLVAPAAPQAPITPGGPSPTPVPVATNAPNTLPYVLPDFTGRSQILSELYAAAGAGDTIQPHVRVVMIDGMGGSGKSTLAIHAAHRLRDQYPGGQLYIDFKSYTANATPLDAHQALGIALSALGVAENAIPGNLEARAATWRAVTSGTPLLVLLDNAADSQDVSALIPNCPGSLVLVTSRDQIPGLDGALSIRLGMLEPAESIEMIERILGRERVTEEPAAAAELARLCGHLPLALRISAARLVNRSHQSIEWLTSRLADETRRLDMLSMGERSVTASIRSSDQAMRPDCRRALRLISLHPGASFDVFSVCSLLGADEVGAEEILELLLDRHLLEPHPNGRYGIHDLVRAYALQYQDNDDQDGSDPADRGQTAEALEPLLSYYAVVSGAASDLAFPGRNRYGDYMPAYAGPVPALADQAAAVSWFDAEHRAALSLIRIAAERGSHAHVAHITRNLAHYLHLRDLSKQFHESARLAVESCRAAGSPLLLSNALVNLAIALWQCGQVAEGTELLDEALGLAERAGDTLSQTVCLSRLGAFRHTLGENDAAATNLRRAIELLAQLDRPREEALARISLCGTLLDLGHFQEAAQQARNAAETCRVERQSYPRILALANLGKALVHCGDAAGAVSVLNSAYDLTRMLQGETTQAALVLANLAEAYAEAGQAASAAIYAEQAGRLVTSGRSAPALRSGVLNTLGLVHRELAERSMSAERHEAALDLARDSSYVFGEARALAGLAAACEDADDARQYRESADAIFDQHGVPESLRALC